MENGEWRMENGEWRVFTVCLRPDRDESLVG